MLDFWNQELAVDDEVAFEHLKYRRLIRGRILRFTPKGVRIEYVDNGQTKTYFTQASNVVRKP